MTHRSLARPAQENTPPPLEQIAERVEEEIARLRKRRPAVGDRLERAEHLLVTHLACRKQRLIRVRVRGGRSRFLVQGSGGAVYVVDPGDWSCTCPDHCYREVVCKHALAGYILHRAARPARRRVRTCAGCSQRLERRELVEV